MAGRTQAPETPLLIGRQTEMGVIEDLARRITVAGDGGAVVIEGEAGIGKSALVLAAADGAAALGVRVLQGSATELEQGRPFGAISDLFALKSQSSAAETSRLAELLFPHDPMSLGDDRSSGPHFVEEMMDLIEAMSLDRPLMLVLEDIHWADTPSLQSLQRVMRGIAQLPLGLIVTLRTTRGRAEVAGTIDELTRRAAKHLFLKPLDAASVAEISRATLGRTPGPSLIQNLGRAGGNPFFINQLLRAYEDEDLLEWNEQEVDVAAGVLPSSMTKVVLRRVSTLGPDVFGLLRRAAILGSSFPIRDLETINREPQMKMLEMLQGAVDIGLLRDDGDRLAFHHDLVREILYLDTAAAVRREIHRDAARRLAEAGASALSVAAHISQRAEPGDRFDIHWLRRAAEEAALHDPPTATKLLGEAIELSSPNDPDYSPMLAQHLRMKLWIGDSAAGEELARTYLKKDLRPEDEALIRFGLTQSLIAQSRFAEAVAEGSSALATAPAGSARARLKVETSFAHLFSGMEQQGTLLAESALTEADEVDDSFGRAAAAIALGLASLARGQGKDALTWADRGLQEAWSSRDPEFARGPMLSLGAAIFVYMERFELAEEHLHRGIELLTEAGTEWMIGIFYAALGHLRMMSGRWDDALAEYETAVNVSEENENTAPLAGVRASEAQILARRGDLDAGLMALREGQRLIDKAGGVHWNGPDVARAHAVLAEIRGDVDQALAILTNLWQMTTMLGMTGFAVPAAVDVALVAIRHSRGDALAEVAGTLDVEEGALPPTIYGTTLCIRGIVARDPDVVEAGVARLGETRNLLQRGLWCEEAALSLHAMGKTGVARELANIAASSYADLSASHDQARLQRRARGIGIHLGGRGARPTAKTGWSSLTKTQRTIVALVAEGMRNREIAERLYISPRTVETHLTRVYAKLGIRSRAQLVRLAGERSKDP